MESIVETLRTYLKSAIVAAVAVGAALKPVFDFLSEVVGML